MGTQPEVATYDATVYELETTDLVQGGPGGNDNKALLNLANRTGWLKGQIAALAGGFGAELALPGYQKLPSGLIVQWFTALVPGDSTRRGYNLPIPFPLGHLFNIVSYQASPPPPAGTVGSDVPNLS